MFEYNKEAATKGASTGGFIKESGDYIGEFTSVAKIVSSTGAQCLVFFFKSDCGATNSFEIYHKNGSGEELFGKNQIISIMTCMSLKSTPNIATKTLKYYGVETEMECLTDFEGKKIGIIFQRELSSWKGKNYDNAIYVTSFNPQNNRMSDEIAADKPAKRKEKVLASLVPVIDNREPSAMGSPAPQDGGDFDDFDDEIPFN